MYVLDMVGTIILFINKCMEKKIFLGRERFQSSGGDANQIFIFIWPKQCPPASRDK